MKTTMVFCSAKIEPKETDFPALSKTLREAALASTAGSIVSLAMARNGLLLERETGGPELMLCKPPRARSARLGVCGEALIYDSVNPWGPRAPELVGLVKGQEAVSMTSTSALRPRLSPSFLSLSSALACFQIRLSTSMSAQAPQVPESLERAYSRLLFPPSYVVVGVYRLFSDRALFGPAWAKCHHGVRRGAIVGFAWVRCFAKL
jgi:hypothetical protein